jgi:hypothetical protein
MLVRLHPGFSTDFVHRPGIAHGQKAGIDTGDLRKFDLVTEFYQFKICIFLLFANFREENHEKFLNRFPALFSDIMVTCH